MLNACIILIITTQAQNISAPVYGPTNSTWNYDNAGNDWTYPTCALTNYVQAPIDLSNTAATNNSFTGSYDFRWADNGFSFLPDF